MPIFNVQAQGETLLQAIPDVNQIPAGNQVLFRLEVTNGVDVNAFDVSIDYDEDQLELTSWKYGNYLSNLSSVYKEDQTGFFRLAATQIATPAVSGDGVLLELLFKAKGTGTAVVAITEAKFADPDGNLIHPASQSGQVIVTNAPTYTATSAPTLTPTATKTPSPAPTNTPKPTKTRTPTRTQTAEPTSTSTPTPTATRTLTPSATLSDRQTTPRPEQTGMGEMAYPVQGEVTLTLTEPAGETSTSVSAMVPMDEDNPASEGDNRSEESSNGALVTTSQAGWLNITLWCVLILASIAIVIMLIILIKRRRKKTEDLL